MSAVRFARASEERALMGRIGIGFDLAGKSWSVVRREPRLILLTFLSIMLSAATALGLFAIMFERLPNGSDIEFPRYLSVVPFVWAATFVSTWANCVITVIADHRLRGEHIATRQAMVTVAPRTLRILLWVLVSGFVGLVLTVIADRLKLGGKIAEWLFGLAWAIATVFVVPVLVLEDQPVRPAIRRSTTLVTSKWAETLSAQMGVGLATTIIALPLAVGVGLTAIASVPVALTLGVVLLAVFIAATGALDAVLRVATYRHAVHGGGWGPFNEHDLASRFQPAD
jgi:hypothetical protein